MKKYFKSKIQSYLNKKGYQIIKTSSNKQHWLQKLNIQTIIDVGANEGQFIKYINTILLNKKIYAFEPIKACYDQLVKNTQSLNIKIFNCGLSDQNGTAEINISNNLVSSSMLEMDNLHIQNYPESHYITKQSIQLKRLDDVIDQIQKNILLKIDVQGYENKVIAGGTNIITASKVILIESCFQTLYKGQWLFDDIYKHFVSKGFKFMGFLLEENIPQFHNATLPLFADSIFINMQV